MPLTKSQIRTGALALKAHERELLAQDLLLSITRQDRDAIDAAWLVEIRRREGDYAAGKTGSKPVQEVIRRLKRRSAP